MFRIETPKSERGRQGILLHRQEKNRLEQESKQAAFQEEMSQNLSESFISLNSLEFFLILFLKLSIIAVEFLYEKE